jgi:hypothetical protein
LARISRSTQRVRPIGEIQDDWLEQNIWNVGVNSNA